MEYPNRYVAFIDILGFKSLVAQSACNSETLNLLNRVMNYLVDAQRENYRRDMPNIGKEVSVFSDSVVISWDGTCPGAGFYTLLDMVFICNDLLFEGILVRGGITYGALIHDHDGARCFGPAMVAAYQLESQRAIYPRILIDPSVIEADLRNPGSANSPDQELEYLDHLIVGHPDSGEYDLDFLSQLSEFNSPEDYDHFIWKTREHIIFNLKSTCNMPSVHAKYEWLGQYFNATVQKVYQNPSDRLIQSIESLMTVT